MPNDITNKLFVDGPADDVANLMAAIRHSYTNANGNRQFQPPRINFEKIIPMPESLKIEHCYGHIEEAAEAEHSGDRVRAAIARARFRPGDQEIYDQMLFNLRTYGHPYWYGWSCEHWGTKWNAYGTPDKRDTEDTIWFETAWATPLPVLIELSCQHPTVSLMLDYADEDTGHNCGTYRFEHGEAQRLDSLTYGTPEAIKFAMDLRYGHMDAEQLKEHGLNPDYTYIEDEDE